MDFAPLSMTFRAKGMVAARNHSHPAFFAVQGGTILGCRSVSVPPSPMRILPIAPLSPHDSTEHGTRLDPMDYFDGIVIAALRETYVARLRQCGLSADRCANADIDLAVQGEANVIAFHDTITGQNN